MPAMTQNLSQTVRGQRRNTPAQAGLRTLALALALALPGLAAAADTKVQAFVWPQELSQAQADLLNDTVAAQMGQALDLKAAQDLSSRLTLALRKAGYPVATVVLSDDDWAQFNKDGMFKPHVFLGVVGRVEVSNNTSEVHAERLQRTVEQALCGAQGLPCVLTSAGLERAQLLLQDIPGLQLQSLGLSAQGVGLGQTAVLIAAQPSGARLSGHVSADNYGVPSSGSNRVGADAQFANLLHEGDTWQVGAMSTSQHQNTGMFSLSVPLGVSGLRAQLDASRSVYAVPQVNANGAADSGSVGLTYPVVRGLDRNWIGGVSFFGVLSEQQVNGVSASAPTHLQGIKFSLNADDGDRPKELGDSFWSASSVLSAGRDRQTLPVATDPTGTVGNYTKLLASALGKQVLDANWYLVGNAHAQLASHNLNSYEAMGVGGVGGVRAYSPNEGALDDGVYLSAELRRLVGVPGGQLAPGVWIDYVNGDVLRHPYPGWQTNMGFANNQLSNHRVLRGWGLGLDWIGSSGLSAGVTVGWKLPGSPDSAVQPGSARTRILASLGLKF